MATEFKRPWCSRELGDDRKQHFATIRREYADQADLLANASTDARIFVPDGLSAAARTHLEQAQLTYEPVGVSTYGLVGQGFHSVTSSSCVGTGRERFDQATARLLSWQMHRESGMSVRASSPIVADGVVAVLGVGIGRLRISAPVRVVNVIEEPNRRGFAYGTLPGHPVSGEEQFLLRHEPDGSVVFEISAVSRAKTPLARLGGPVTRAVQSHLTDRYLDSV